MSEMTLAQLTEWVRTHGTDHRDLRKDTVPRELYDQAMTDIRSDLGELKETQKWTMRLVIGIVLTNMAGLIYFLATQAPG